MFKEKLKLKVKLDKRKITERVEKMSSMHKEASVAWTIISFALKMFSLIFFGALILFPFFFMISNALMNDIETQDTLNAHVVPEHGLHWENFSRAFEDGYWSALLTTLIVTAASIVLKLILTISMGYGFSYKKWWGKKIMWYFLISLMMIPEIALVVGQYKVAVKLNMHVGDQILIAMVLPFIAHIFSAFMFRNAFEAIPNRIKEAALIDGASEFKYFWKVALPMITPTIWTVVILTAFASWNSYMWPQLLTFGLAADEKKDVLGTWLFNTGKINVGGEQQRLLMNVRLAAAILVTVPMIIIYFAFRTKIMKAISRQGNAIKG